MNGTWNDAPEPPQPRYGPRVLARTLARGLPMAALVFGGLALLLVMRLFERPFYGLARPFTPHLTVFVCRNALRIMGLKFVQRGTPMVRRGAVVANHASWLDIFALNAASRIYFVAKSEVAAWPGIGWLARATGTLFIERNPARARDHTELLRNRLLAGHKLLFFPEGTSTDGRRVLPFKTTLFAAFFDPELRDEIAVQPVSLVYHAPAGEIARFYGWWGNMDFASHLLRMLAAPRHGSVEVIYHAPVLVAEAGNRKALAAACEEAVREGYENRANPG